MREGEASLAAGGTGRALVDEWVAWLLLYERGFAPRLGWFRNVQLGRSQYRDGVVSQPVWICYITASR